MLWALTIGGQEGVQHALETLRLEIELAMALLGCRWALGGEGSDMACKGGSWAGAKAGVDSA